MDIALVSAFIVGLFSSLHCLGMCGGIIGALTFSLPPAVREHRWRLFPYISAYNLGRITSYTAAGALLGWLGDSLFKVLSPDTGHLILQGIASAMMIGIGLYLAEWFPRFAMIEQLGKPLWKRLQPWGQKLIPVRSPWHAWLFGLVWGWLPCGLVYSALIISGTAGDAVYGALFMLSFGAGTLPSVMTAGILTGWMARLSRLTQVKMGVGLLLIVLAIASFYLTWAHGHQHVSVGSLP
ncbi:sulfite exporter TauE/SafE family protein [Thiohalophilus sp.]|uniref:sulfite exporter TauE/SafE family protein n=1 Tax=Thiohalophilus sp. TaxID=3028392 RepID=UPI002ACEEA45|nr:sulfite exporter TauE/SafE family protein [Thiohalophilus sp.]MDZ7661929.1 sulfite exporter TauE/SafE family protein [Thiohalophilus sp.]MDZ7803795.1 sulfite exporter TauE/SafE family protein [Thiohalophilus sp.]